MQQESEAPFYTIESAQEYLMLLSQTIAEARSAVTTDIVTQGAAANSRHHQALLIVSYSLEKLGWHITASRRILNDLRTLRILLHQERVPTLNSEIAA